MAARAGIGDNAAAVAVAVDMVEALAPTVARPLAVVFTVGEEGLGNLRGALHASLELRPELAIALRAMASTTSASTPSAPCGRGSPCAARAATRGGIAAGRAPCTRSCRC